MKKIVLLFSLLLMVCGMTAQSTGQIDEKKMTEYRETIGLDYSMPDFDTNKINAKVIGVRLARLLQSLEVNYTQGYYNRTLASILAEQLENPAYKFFNQGVQALGGGACSVPAARPVAGGPGPGR